MCSIMYPFIPHPQERFSGEDVYTTKESERLMRLPMFYNLDMEDAKRVVDAIASFDGF